MSHVRGPRRTELRGTRPNDLVYHRVSDPGGQLLPLPLLEVMEDWLQAQRFSASLLAVPAPVPSVEPVIQLSAELRARLAGMILPVAEGRRGNARKQ